MNICFSKVVIDLSSLKYHDYEDIFRNISDPILKTIVKYINHPSVRATKKVSNLNNLFSFDIVEKEKEI